MANQAQPMAIINDSILGVGDSIDGATVVSISQHKVVLRYKNKLLSLTV